MMACWLCYNKLKKYLITLFFSYIIVLLVLRIVSIYFILSGVKLSTLNYKVLLLIVPVQWLSTHIY